MATLGLGWVVAQSSLAGAQSGDDVVIVESADDDTEADAAVAWEASPSLRSASGLAGVVGSRFAPDPDDPDDDDDRDDQDRDREPDDVVSGGDEPDATGFEPPRSAEPDAPGAPEEPDAERNDQSDPAVGAEPDPPDQVEPSGPEPPSTPVDDDGERATTEPQDESESTPSRVPTPVAPSEPDEPDNSSRGGETDDPPASDAPSPSPPAVADDQPSPTTVAESSPPEPPSGAGGDQNARELDRPASDRPQGAAAESGDVDSSEPPSPSDESDEFALGPGPLASLEVGGVTRTGRVTSAVRSPWVLPVEVTVSCGGHEPVVLRINAGQAPGTVARAPLDVGDLPATCLVELIEDGIGTEGRSLVSMGAPEGSASTVLTEGHTTGVAVDGADSVLRVTVTFDGIQVETAMLGPASVEELGPSLSDDIAVPIGAMPIHRTVPIQTTAALAMVFGVGLAFSITRSRRPL